MTATGPDDELWQGLASGAQRMLTAGAQGFSLTEAGSAMAFAGVDAADFNLAFAWSDTAVLSALAGRDEDFLLIASPTQNSMVAEHANALSLEAISEPLPVWEGVIDESLLPPETAEVRKASSSDMAVARSVLSESFGLSLEQCVQVFPDSLTDDIDVYLTERDGTAIATLMAVLNGTQVSLWSGGSLPGVRGKGVFTSIVAHALREHAARGARTFAGITEAVGSGRVLQRLGGVHRVDGHVWLRGSSVGELIQE